MDNSKRQRKTHSRKLFCLLVIGLICFFAGTINAKELKIDSKNPSENQQANITISGVIIDSKGEPLIGVSVVVKGTTQGTLTDVDGKYTINTVAGATLTYTYVGFKTEAHVVNNSRTLNITMQEDAHIMSEVVVVGYGAQKKENLTGAVVSIDVGKTLNSRPITDVGRGLQGAVPGMTITIPSGEIGSDPSIKIRGQIASIKGNANPLILLDNVEIPSIQMVNPDDIESISVLKDAAASSIYGAKAAFGVVLITSKKGANSEKVTIQYSNNFSWQNVAKSIDMGTIDALDYSLTAAERTGGSMTGAFWKADRASWEKSKEWYNKYGGSVKSGDPILYGRDWYMQGTNKMGVRLYEAYDYMIREWAPAQTHNFSVSGKTDKLTYNASLGYLKQEGMMKPAKEDDFSRYNANIRLSSELNKYITVRAGALYSQRTKRYAYSTNSTTADAWYYVYRWGPTQPFGYEDGIPLRSPEYEVASANTAQQQYNYTSINIGATVNFTKDWTLDADYTFSNNEYNWDKPGTHQTAKNSWGNAVLKTDANGNQIYVNENGDVVSAGAEGAMPAYELVNTTYNGVGSAIDHIYRRAENSQRGTSNVYTTYNLKLTDEHTFKFMAGLNWVKLKNKYNWSQKTNLFDPSNPQFDLATGTMTSGGGTEWESQLGYFGRINYMFMDKYLLEANLRYDGSSKFPTDLRWRWFPSFSGGWIVTNESFMKPVEPILSFMKLRASWGTIGDQTVANDLYVPLMTSFTAWTSPASYWVNDAGKVQGYSTPVAADKNISWQNIETLNIGVDSRFFKDKLGVTYDWFQRYTRDMITPGVELPATFGGPVPQGNYGELRTRGWELTVDFNHRFSNGLGINFMATLSDASTYITGYPEDAAKSITSATAHNSVYYKGKRFGDIWGYKTERLYQKDDFVYNADGTIQTVVINGKTMNKLKGDNPVYQDFLQTGDGFMFGPGDVKYADLDGNGTIGNGSGVDGDSGDLTVIGNSTPRYNYGFRLGADYKGFDFSMFFQGVGKRDIWGNGLLAIPGYNAGDGAMPQTIAGDFWKEDRTDAFYPRPYDSKAAAYANTSNNMAIQSRYLLNMAYLRLKNVTLGYSLPSELIKKAYLSNARVYLSMENLFTFDNLRGLPIDPETESGYSMFNTTNYNSGRTGSGTPMFKSFSFGVQLTF